MPIPTPFHERTRSLCTSYRWKDWSGYYAVCSYDICHEREYNAFRQAAGVLDVTPLFKYDVTGPEAAAFLSRVMVRNIQKLKVGRVVYLCWCDEHGMVLDDGTCARLGEQHFRVTAAAPSYHWFIQHAQPFDCAVEDTTARYGALAIQGPNSREILRQITDIDLDDFRFFAVGACQFDGIPGWLTRTGYTGDLGYELWVNAEHGVRLWDALMDAGKAFGIEAAGLDALDVTRVEAGFIMQGVDYFSAHEAMIDSQKSTPFELGLGWTVKLKDRLPFIGQEALEREKVDGSRGAMGGLDISWEALERLYDAYELPPCLPSAAWRTAVPVYSADRQIGRATSGAWSPILKRNLALATVESRYAEPGTVVDFEVTVEWERKKVPATVVKPPFFNPERKRSNIEPPALKEAS